MVIYIVQGNNGIVPLESVKVSESDTCHTRACT